MIRLGLRLQESGVGAGLTLLAAALLATGGGALSQAAPVARAESGATLLAPAIPEADRAGQARGVFFSASYALDLPGRVRLAGTPDGSGALCTDDEAIISFTPADGLGQEWRHLFSAPGRRGVQCLPAQAVDLAAGPGRYTVAITLTDRFPDTFSSSSYYLVADPTTDDRQPTADPGLAVAAVSPTAAAPTVGPSPTPTAAPTSTPALAPAAALSAPPAPARSADWLPWIGGAGAALLLLALAVMLRPRQHRAPTLRGIVDLRDRETGETRTLLLHQYPRGVGIARRPLAATPIGDHATPPLARILPDPAGPLLAFTDPEDGPQRTPLRGGDQLLVQQALELRVRKI